MSTNHNETQDKPARIDLDAMTWRGGERRHGVDMAPPSDWVGDVGIVIFCICACLLFVAILLGGDQPPPACVVQGAEQHSTD